MPRTREQPDREERILNEIVERLRTIRASFGLVLLSAGQPAIPSHGSVQTKALHFASEGWRNYASGRHGRRRRLHVGSLRFRKVRKVKAWGTAFPT